MAGLSASGGLYPLPVVALVLVLYGLATQAWLLERGDGPGAANELIALNNGTMFRGFSLAGGIGGLALEANGLLAVPEAAAGCVLLSLALFWGGFHIRAAKESEQMMRIGEVARCTGVSTRALRYYEVPSAKHDLNGYRIYDSDAVLLVRDIARRLHAGLSTEDVLQFVHCLGKGLESNA